MTTREAIEILNELHDQCCQADSIFCTDVTGARCDAVDMAIKALEGKDTNVPSRKGVFIPDITVEMFRNASLEGVEDLMVSGVMEDISLPFSQPDIIPLDWIQRYADDWEDMNYAYDNPILGMLEDWRREQDEQGHHIQTRCY